MDTPAAKGGEANTGRQLLGGIEATYYATRNNRWVVGILEATYYVTKYNIYKYNAFFGCLWQVCQQPSLPSTHT